MWLWNIGASHRLFGCICVVVLIQIESGIYNKYYFKHSTIVNHKPTFVMARRDPILEENKGGHHGNTVVGVETKRIIGKLCIQELIKGGNDIDQLILFNKGTKSACCSSPSQKEPDDIMSHYL